MVNKTPFGAPERDADSAFPPTNVGGFATEPPTSFSFFVAESLFVIRQALTIAMLFGR
jgi:hypothetical protein